MYIYYIYYINCNIYIISIFNKEILQSAINVYAKYFKFNIIYHTIYNFTYYIPNATI